MKRLGRRKDVRAIDGLSHSQRDRLEARGEYPKRVHLSERCVAWPLDEVEAWVKARIAARDTDAATHSRVGRRLAEAKKTKREAEAAQ